MNPCSHPEFSCQVDMFRLTDATGAVESYQSGLRIRCKECGCPFEFLGFLPGLDGGRPTVSSDGYEMRAPVRPKPPPVKLRVVSP